jgi:conjugative relaxase-like TrwC/TraI family protein
MHPILWAGCAVAWFWTMGANEVAYHEATVLGREGDHPGQALDYYGSRGETPLRWGGAGAARLGLHGEVTREAYRLAFGPGGFRDPLTGQPLVGTKRPGFELVVSAHKSLSLLGLVGGADDMHAILDTETAGTVGYLEAWAQSPGGRRGRAAVATPTTGLAYAVTRHGTSREGDPHVHDHVLIANVCEMRDAKGGYKALRSDRLRDLVEPAAMVGRLHSAAKAIELGYAIELDQGRSGRARTWRIAGIPPEVCEIFSKRSDQIGEYLAEMGYTSYRARSVAARRNRPVKRGTGTDQLMPRWISELEAHGWTIDRLAASLDHARRQCRGLARPLTDAEIDHLAAELLDPDGEFLARWKVFDRPRLIAEIAPLLYGHHPAELDRVVDRVLVSELVVPLIGIAGACDQPYAAAAVLVTEHTIAGILERLTRRRAPVVSPEVVEQATAAKQSETLRSLIWRLDREQITLDRRTVVVLDEASLTPDIDLARLLVGVDRAGSKLVIVGDPRQLAPVGPGGALHALLERHPDIVTVLNHNLRQRDRAERTALHHLRAGNVQAARRLLRHEPADPRRPHSHRDAGGDGRCRGHRHRRRPRHADARLAAHQRRRPQPPRTGQGRTTGLAHRPRPRYPRRPRVCRR